jgi:hypothetical protein
MLIGTPPREPGPRSCPRCILGRGASTCTSPLASSCSYFGADYHAGCRGGLLRVYHPADFASARIAEHLLDRNRKDSLQLLRIQNGLNSLALAMRDMLANDEPYPLTAWSAQFQRIRADLDDALRREEQVAVTDRAPEQRQYLGNSVAQFWGAAERTFALARDGKGAEAKGADQNSG